MNRWVRIVGAGILLGTLLPTVPISQTRQSTQTPGPYALFGIMRSRDEGHSVDLEAGYVRHSSGTDRLRIHSTGIAIQSRHPLNDNGGLFTRPSGTPLPN